MDDVKYKKASGNEFSKIINKVREKGDLFKANIHPYTPEEYKAMNTFLSADGKSGFAVKPNGELVSVFSTERGRGKDLVQQAKKMGAEFLDAYDIDGKLPTLYGEAGFEEIGRQPFNPEYADPSNKLLMEKQPDFVEMALPEDDPNKLTRSEMRRGGKRARRDLIQKPYKHDLLQKKLAKKLEEELTEPSNYLVDDVLKMQKAQDLVEAPDLLERLSNTEADIKNNPIRAKELRTMQAKALEDLASAKKDKLIGPRIQRYLSDIGGKLPSLGTVTKSLPKAAGIAALGLVGQMADASEITADDLQKLEAMSQDASYDTDRIIEARKNALRKLRK